MAIIKAIEKCVDCYKDTDCMLTLKMREFCAGPYRDRRAHIAALKADIYRHKREQA